MRNAGLGAPCLATWWIVDDGRSAVHALSPADDRLGATWAVIATISVFRTTVDESATGVLSRIAATAVAFALCLAYLAAFGFGVLGLAAVVAAAGVAASALGRPQDAATAAVTATVVLVVASLSPADGALTALLRLVDTAIGAATGLAVAWVLDRAGPTAR